MTISTIIKNKRTIEYQCRILIRHPNIDPQVITEHLGLVPIRFWCAGKSRKTPAGTVLNGTYDDSMWSYSKYIRNNQPVENEIDEIVELLNSKIQFITMIIESGGKITIILNLPGQLNIGGEISIKSMQRLSMMKVNFGFEVFPDFN